MGGVSSQYGSKKKNGRFLGKINILKNFFKLAATLHIHIF